MFDTPRMRRLRSDYKSLERLQAESTIFNFTSIGTPPDHYVLTFHGRGMFRPEHANEPLTRLQHEVVLRLGSGYPRHAPSLTWRTPIFHPNIAANGTVCLGAYGQHWAPSVTLDELCHMLWDIVRYANFDVDSPYNRDAAMWTRAADKTLFPLDARPLRDITAGIAKSTRSESPPANVPKPHVPPAKATSNASPISQSNGSEVLFIEEDDVVEAEIVTEPQARPRHSTENDEILFIN
jgi:ubiquitin-protein ligase